MKQFEREEKNRFDFLQLKPIRDPIQHFHISLDVVELGDARYSYRSKSNRKQKLLSYI